MEDKKIKVTVEYEDVFEVRVIFDNDEKTKERCELVNDFWSGNKSRLSDADDCIYKCVTRLIANEIIRLQMKSSFYCGEDAAIKAFDEGIEGFFPIDGSSGIKLDYCDDWELDSLDVSFEKEEIKEEK